MISLIICSRKPDIPASLRENIHRTIGVPYEFIIIDNSANTYSIFTAYNKGVELSKYPFLLFMHDDIIYRDHGWGKKLLQYFEDPQTGAAGIAGTPYLPAVPGGWWSGGLGYLYLNQPDAAGQIRLHDYSCKLSDSREVVVLDGVWFCIRRSLFSRIRFDDQTFDGFHFYDTDISLQIHHTGHKLSSVHDILIEHTSAGVLDEKWTRQAWKFFRKWEKQLPASCIPVPFSQECLSTYRMINEFTWEEVRLCKGDKSKIRKVRLTSLKTLLSFTKGYRYFRMPAWIIRFTFRFLKSLF